MSAYRVVKLLKNHIYPTYQLHAFMANKKTLPQDGLRLAALTTLEWLCYRLGENTPEELKGISTPEEYRTASDDCLASVHLNSGYMIDIVSLPQQGIWTLQIAEPDLGPDPGNEAQTRLPVAGRVIETNVAFKIVDNRLECGFQTMISDPDGVSERAETYRLAIVRRLANHPDFGLQQVERLTPECVSIESVDKLKSVISIARNTDNDLPCVFFTQILQAPASQKVPAPVTVQNISLPASPAAGFSPDLFSFSADPKCREALRAAAKAMKASAPTDSSTVEKTPADPPYDMDTFAKYGIALCRTYLLPHKLLERFSKLFDLQLTPGDIAILEPVSFGGKSWIIPYKAGKRHQEEALALLRDQMHQYPREKEINFGHIAFLSAARETLLDSTHSARQEAESISEQWAEKIDLLQSQWCAQLKEKEDECRDLREQLYRQRQYTARVEQEKEELRTFVKAEQSCCQTAVEQKDELITALRRRLNQPKDHSQIAAWVEKEFAGKLLLHPKAAALLNEKSARTVNISLICDALDFLATDYWERRYHNISTEEMNKRCGEKYGRPFDVMPTGTTSIEFTPGEYKIKYFIGKKGKPVESALDYHLRVGNHTENLLRIYFLHDDEKQLIVVGSLPCHLRAVSIK